MSVKPRIHKIDLIENGLVWLTYWLEYDHPATQKWGWNDAVSRSYEFEGRVAVCPGEPDAWFHDGIVYGYFG